MELRADHHPALDAALDRLDHAVRGPGGHLEALGDIVDAHVVHAVDANLAVAIDAFHHGAGLHDEGVPVGLIDRVLVRDRLGKILWDVQEQCAPLGDVEQLHAAADRQHGHVPGADVLGQQAVEVFATGVHRSHGWVRHVAIATRVEVGPSHQHHAVEQVEQANDVFLIGQGRQDHGDAARGGDAVVVAGRDEREGGMLLAGGAVVGVDANEGFDSHGIPLEKRQAGILPTSPATWWSFRPPSACSWIPPPVPPHGTPTER